MSSDTSDIDQSQTDSSTSEQEVRPSERIRIGSQRNSLYRATTSRPSADEEQAQVTAASDAAAVEEVPAVEEPPKPMPVTPAAPPAPKKEPKHYPPPNIRDQLSPELEQEYQA